MRDVHYHWAAPKYYLFQWYCIVFKSYLQSSCTFHKWINNISAGLLLYSLPPTFILQLNLDPIKRNYFIAQDVGIKYEAEVSIHVFPPCFIGLFVKYPCTAQKKQEESILLLGIVLPV